MTTFIDTKKCRRVKLSDARGEMAEIVNRALCGAENVVGMLRWLGQGERFEAQSLPSSHQLVYLVEGSGIITLENKDYAVTKGAGTYLAPEETASVRPTDGASLKLLHLVVPKLPAR